MVNPAPHLAQVSVIMPNHDRTDQLFQAALSVHRQTFPDWRCYIIDDGSTPRLVSDVYTKIQMLDSRFTILYQNRRGVSSARNLGILWSREPWIALLDSDDLWQPTKLERQLAAAQKEQPTLWHTEEIWIRNGVRVNPKQKHRKGGGDQFLRSLPFCIISPSAALFPRSKLSRWGVFDERFPIAEDYDLWLRVTSNQEVGFLEEPLTIKQGGHEDQLSRAPLMDYWRLRSLEKIFLFGNLNLQHKQAVQMEAGKKIEVLANGGRKRQNLHLLHELNRMKQNILKAFWFSDIAGNASDVDAPFSQYKTREPKCFEYMNGNRYKEEPSQPYPQKERQ